MNASRLGQRQCQDRTQLSKSQQQQHAGPESRQLGVVGCELNMPVVACIVGTQDTRMNACTLTRVGINAGPRRRAHMSILSMDAEAETWSRVGLQVPLRSHSAVCTGSRVRICEVHD